MKVTITVKEVNPDFDQELADRIYEGKESDNNILYNWEDQFEVTVPVREFKIENNTTYELRGYRGETPFVYAIPGMTVINCIHEDGTVTQFAASRKLIKDTKKNVNKAGDVHFFLFLRGKKEIINPVNGVYILEKDFPNELPVPDEDEEE